MSNANLPFASLAFFANLSRICLKFALSGGAVIAEVSTMAVVGVAAVMRASTLSVASVAAAVPISGVPVAVVAVREPASCRSRSSSSHTGLAHPLRSAFYTCQPTDPVIYNLSFHLRWDGKYASGAASTGAVSLSTVILRVVYNM